MDKDLSRIDIRRRLITDRYRIDLSHIDLAILYTLQQEAEEMELAFICIEEVEDAVSLVLNMIADRGDDTPINADRFVKRMIEMRIMTSQQSRRNGLTVFDYHLTTYADKLLSFLETETLDDLKGSIELLYDHLLEQLERLKFSAETAVDSEQKNRLQNQLKSLVWEALLSIIKKQEQVVNELDRSKEMLKAGSSDDHRISDELRRYRKDLLDPAASTIKALKDILHGKSDRAKDYIEQLQEICEVKAIDTLVISLDELRVRISLSHEWCESAIRSWLGFYTRVLNHLTWAVAIDAERLTKSLMNDLLANYEKTPFHLIVCEPESLPIIEHFEFPDETVHLIDVMDDAGLIVVDEGELEDFELRLRRLLREVRNQGVVHIGDLTEYISVSEGVDQVQRLLLPLLNLVVEASTNQLDINVEWIALPGQLLGEKIDFLVSAEKIDEIILRPQLFKD